MELEYQLRRVKYMDTIEAIFYLLLELLKPSKPTPNFKPPLSSAMRQAIQKFEQYQKKFRLLHYKCSKLRHGVDFLIRDISAKMKPIRDQKMQC